LAGEDQRGDTQKKIPWDRVRSPSKSKGENDLRKEPGTPIRGSTEKNEVRTGRRNEGPGKALVRGKGSQKVGKRCTSL